MKTVIITGASRGIGLATAKKFLTNNWMVIGTSRSGQIPIQSQLLIPIRLDLAEPESIKRAVYGIQHLEQPSNFRGRENLRTTKIDVLINNAAMILDSRQKGIDMKKLRATLEVDLINTIDFTEALLPLIDPNGHIINIGSSYGSMSKPIDDDASHSYRIAKAGLNMYTRILAYRLAHTGIKVSALDPGWVKTDMGYDVADETERPDREPEEPAEEIYWLATQGDKSGFFWRLNQKREW